MKKIMVVDDDPDDLQSIKQMLENMDDEYKVTCASSGTRCLKSLENNEIPDLILLDIMMPEISGWEIFKILQENASWKDIPVVFITARTDDFAEEAGNFLAMDYIEKPFDIEDFKKRIDEVLERNES